MPLSRRRTLTQYLIEQRRRFPQASGELNALILDVSIACKAIARAAAFGELGEAAGNLGDVLTSSGEVRKKLDEIGNRMFIATTEWSGHLAGMASEEAAPPVQIPETYARGKYLLVFDAIDGAANIDVNVSVGSIFSILRAPPEVVASGRDVSEEDFLQPGATQVAAGYALYGPMTMLVLTVGNGVVGFTLDPSLGEFKVTHPELHVPPDTHEFAINTSHNRAWEPAVKRYVDECLAGRVGPRGKDFNMRWIASLVAETHRILMRGGVFMDPRDNSASPSSAQTQARRRLLHEANPIGFIMEQAGGRASTGRQPVLGVKPSALHQRIGFFFGSKNEVERIERYHRDPATREAANPLVRRAQPVPRLRA